MNLQNGTRPSPIAVLTKKSYEYFFILILIVLSQASGSCRKDNIEPAVVPPPESKPVVSPGNLIANSSFNLWDSTGNLIKGWSTSLTQQDVLTQDPGGIKFAGNKAGTYYIYQKIPVDMKKFYKASITASYTLNNYLHAGIYVMDSSLHTVLGKFERSYSSATNETWNIIFYSRKETTIAVVIGFMDGINANVVFKNASLTEYKYTPKLSGSVFSSYLSKKIPLSFTARDYDSTINRISDYMNSVMLARYYHAHNTSVLGVRYYYDTDTTESRTWTWLIGNDTNYVYLSHYLRTLDSITVGYCQRSSLSLAEILTNEFNIPVRQLHMVFGTVGEHQFQEYWNPFAGRWIIIDPCFSVRYVKDNVLLGSEDFGRGNAPDLMQQFGVHFYYPVTVDLISLWQGMDYLWTTEDYTMTFPFAS
jgi:hypothetical protein